jgi:hypothetical protein
MAPDNNEGLPSFSTFGEAVRYFREHAGERAGRPYMRMSASGLTRCLTDHSYHITSPSLAELEKGTSLPRDPEAFMLAVCACLGIDVGSKVWTILLQLLIHDIVAHKFGPGVARAFVERDIDALVERLLGQRSDGDGGDGPLTDDSATRQRVS